jgi:hypothetical protein
MRITLAWALALRMNAGMVSAAVVAASMVRRLTCARLGNRCMRTLPGLLFVVSVAVTMPTAE